MLALGLAVAAAPASAQAPSEAARQDFLTAALGRFEEVFRNAETRWAQSRAAAIQEQQRAEASLAQLHTEETNASRAVDELRAAEGRARARWEEASRNPRWTWDDRALTRAIADAAERRRMGEQKLAEIRARRTETDDALRVAAQKQTAADTEYRRVQRQNAAARQRLLAMRDAWLREPSELMWTAFAGEVTKLARSTGVESRVTWKTAPHSGAVVYYQTQDDRRRNLRPMSISNPTETIQSVPIGYYYVWSQRGPIPTSSRERLFRIVGQTEVVTVGENFIQ